MAHLAPLFMEFSRQEYWSGLPFLPPGYLPNSGIEPVSLRFLALVGGFFTTEPPGKTTLLDSIKFLGGGNYLPWPMHPVGPQCREGV